MRIQILELPVGVGSEDAFRPPFAVVISEVPDSYSPEQRPAIEQNWAGASGVLITPEHVEIGPESLHERELREGRDEQERHREEYARLIEQATGAPAYYQTFISGYTEPAPEPPTTAAQRLARELVERAKSDTLKVQVTSASWFASDGCAMAPFAETDLKPYMDAFEEHIAELAKISTTPPVDDVWTERETH